MDMSISSVDYVTPPLYLTLTLLATLLCPFFAYRPLRRYGRSHWLVPALLVSIPVVLNALVSYLQLSHVVLGMAVRGSSSPGAVAAGVAEVLIQLLIGAIAAVLVSVIGFVLYFRGALVPKSQSALTSPLRRSMTVTLILSLLSAIGVFVGAHEVGLGSSARLVTEYRSLFGAAILCAAIVVAIVCELFWLSRGVATSLPALIDTRGTVVALVAAGLSAAVIATIAWVLQARYGHMAMYGRF
jgi:hypothetical protein